MKREKRHNASGISNEGMQFLAMVRVHTCTVCSMYVRVHTCTVCSTYVVCSMCAYMYVPYLRKALHVNTFDQAAQLYLPYHQTPGNVAQTSSSRHFISLI